MNLRIEHQQLRFRISKEELETLCSGERIIQQTVFPDGRILEIDMVVQPIQDTLEIRFEGDSLILLIQKQAAEELYHSLPSREGISSAQKIDDTRSLKLTLEVDIRTQKRKRNDHAS